MSRFYVISRRRHTKITQILQRPNEAGQRRAASRDLFQVPFIYAIRRLLDVFLDQHVLMLGSGTSVCLAHLQKKLTVFLKPRFT